MEVSNAKLKEYTRRIMIARMRLLCNNGFYGLLLMHMKMNISDEMDTAWYDLKDKLYFNPDFLEQVSDRELDYVLMHLLLHVVLKHLNRKGDFEDKYYDQAADIVVNSNILRANERNLASISLENFGGLQPHMVPSGDDGWKYSVEEVYQMLRVVLEPGNGGDSDSIPDEDNNSDCDNGGSNPNNKSVASSNSSYSGWDYHNYESESDKGDGDNNLQYEIWQERVMQAVTAMQRRGAVKNTGLVPAFVQRYLVNLKKPQTDWRTVLDEFIQEEINDYSFCPPDRRFDDSPFFLPDFNEKDFRVEKILFMIDTSGSMSDKEISQCYSEIKGAIDQFDGKLEGWIGFFDAVVIEPKPFVDESEFMAIHPEGGGGTRFEIIFDYVMEHMAEEPPVSIVILTDGYAKFPKEIDAKGIPVLWIIDNEEVTPPWGKIARISIEEVSD